MSQATRRRVFVVDDEHTIASSTAMILRQQGFNATFFTQPLEALQAARSESPDLLLSDVAMPLLSGIDLAIQVKKSCPSCKILLFSGQAATSNMLNAARANGHNFEILSKPVHPTELLRKIQKSFDFLPEQS